MPVLVFLVGLNGDRVLGGRRKILRAYEIERPSGRFALVPSGKVFPAAPKTTQIFFQRLWFTDTLKGISPYIFYQQIDTF